MTEDYLHFIWKKKRIPTFDVKLEDGREATILNVGQHNTNLSGPDFSLGSIELDGIKLFGNIELHVRSSDWIKHNHHTDSNYDNVILHVVYEHDREIIQNGFQLPTLALKDHIDTLHLEAYLNNSKQASAFLCGSQINNIDPIYLESMKLKSLHQKLIQKVNIIQEFERQNDSAVLYSLLAMSFGTSINQESFKTLIRKISLSDLRKVPENKRYNLLKSVSGVVQSDIGGRLGPQSNWHYKGTRPKNFPHLRISQFAFMASRYNFDTSFAYLSPAEIIKYSLEMLNEIWSATVVLAPKLSRSFQYHLVINAIVPFIWYFGEMNEDERIKEKAIDILLLIPPESNNIIKLWKQQKVEIKNAFDSQSLIAQHRFFCNHKKCLSCEVGNKVLNRL